MKKTLSLLTALLLACTGMTACGEKEASSAENNNESSASTTEESAEISPQAELAVSIYNLLNEHGGTLDYGKNYYIASNTLEFADNDCGVNKLIEENFGNNIGDWFICGYDESERRYIEHTQEIEAGYISYVALAEGDDIIWCVTANGQILKEENSLKNFFEEEYSYEGSLYIIPKNVTNAVTADKLISAYENNALEADNNYKNQKIQVTGVVNSVENDIYGDYYVELYNTSKYDYIWCYFANQDDISTLNSGDKITITGTCLGKPYYHVELSGCEIVYIF